MTSEDQEALFRRWLADHIGLMWKVVHAFASMPQDQQDLLQDISLQLWSSLPAFRGEARKARGSIGWPSTRRWFGGAAKGGDGKSMRIFCNSMWRRTTPRGYHRMMSWSNVYMPPSGNSPGWMPRWR